MHNTLSTYALEKRDKLFISSMLELTNKKFGINWALDETNAQVTLVDVDQPTGANFWEAYQSEKKLIAFANTNHLRASWFLEKPLRVQPFTELLKKLSETLPLVATEEVGRAEKTTAQTRGGVQRTLNESAQHYDPVHYLSGVLQTALLAQQAQVVSFSGFDPLYLVPQEKRCYTVTMNLTRLTPAQKTLFSARAEQLLQRPVTLEQARSAIAEQELKPYDIYAFIWGSALLSADGRLLTGHSMQSFVRLKQWPNFTHLPREPAHMKLAAFMLKNAANIPRIASATQLPLATVIDFFNACALSNLLLTQKAQSTSPTMNTTQLVDKPISSEKRGLLGNILRRLGRT